MEVDREDLSKQLREVVKSIRKASRSDDTKELEEAEKKLEELIETVRKLSQTEDS